MSDEVNSSTGEVRISRMRATPDDPWVSVHAITEYEFCPRAGLLAYENKRSGDDDEPPALDILPRFELQAIERTLIDRRQQFFRWLWIFLSLAICGPIATKFDQPAVVVLVGVGMVFVSYRILNVAWDVIVLLKLRHQALTQKCLEPDPYCEEMQAVNWFGMLNLGFESIKLKDALRDHDWRFDGKPWRILRKGSLSIPVFRTRSPQEAPHDQQIVKIMAYCRLASVCFENAETPGAKICPYGIILTGEDYSGFAVPIHPRFRKLFHDSLVALRQLALASDHQSEGVVSNNERGCSACPLGAPRLVALGLRVQRFGAPVNVRSMRSSDGKMFHCDCGDRFQWKPPHDDNRHLW